MNSLAMYNLVVDQMAPGDVLAFQGNRTNILTDLIDLNEGGIPSHIAIVQTGKTQSEDVSIVESTMEGGVSGPQTRLLGATLANYGGQARAWWLQLSATIRAQINWPKFYAFIAASETGSTHYDIKGLFGFPIRDIPFLGVKLAGGENKNVFCSGEFVALFESADVLRGINFTETTPQQVIEMKLYTKAVQILGTPKQLTGFNTI